MKVVISKNDIPIRLTEERWFHIVENHDEMAGKAEFVLEIIADPDIIVLGIRKEFLAVKKIKTRYLVVVYKEISKTDGFIITAFETDRIQYILKRTIVWQKQL